MTQGPGYARQLYPVRGGWLCRRYWAFAFALVLASACTPVLGQVVVGGPPVLLPNQPMVLADGADLVVRRTDDGGDYWPPNGPALPDLLSISVTPFAPSNPPQSLYAGLPSDAGEFLEIKLRLDGLFNPPGPLLAPEDPTLYGPNPVFGFVEFDVDNNVNTGGEIGLPELRYNANVARFGGVPAGPDFIGRTSMNGLDWNGNVMAEPAIHRSGEEFHLALFGDFNAVSNPIIEVTGDGDLIFEAGEQWIVKGNFFHRAHAYENLTFSGSYAPLVHLRFLHNATADVTVVTLVYPLTNSAYAAAINGSPEAEDAFDNNANSIREALGHVQISASQQLTINDPYWPLIEEWAGLNVDDMLDPRYWRTTVLLGTAMDSEPSGGRIDYSDILPNIVPGDFNHDGLATNSDAQMVADYIALHDDHPGVDAADTDGPDGEVVIIDFGIRFHAFDVNYDGVIDANDAAFSQQMPGDFDTDEDVDLRDFAVYQRNFGLNGTLGDVDPANFRFVAIFDAFDFDENDVIDLLDLVPFVAALTGP